MQIQNKKQNKYFLKQNHVLIFQADSYYYQQYLMFHISYTLCFLVRYVQVAIISVINHRDVDIKHLFHQQITCKTCKSRKIIHPFLASRNFYFSLFKITRTACQIVGCLIAKLMTVFAFSKIVFFSFSWAPLKLRLREIFCLFTSLRMAVLSPQQSMMKDSHHGRTCCSEHERGQTSPLNVRARRQHCPVGATHLVGPPH